MGALTEVFNSLKEVVISNFVGIVIGFVLCSWLNKPKQSTGNQGGMPMGGQGGMQQRQGGMSMGGQGGMQNRQGGMSMGGQGGMQNRQGPPFGR